MDFLDLTDATDTEKRKINEILYNNRPCSLVELPFDLNAMVKKPFTSKPQVKSEMGDGVEKRSLVHPEGSVSPMTRNGQQQVQSQLLHPEDGSQSDPHSVTPVSSHSSNMETHSFMHQPHAINSFDHPASAAFDPSSSSKQSHSQQQHPLNANPAALPIQPLPYPIVTHMPVMSSMAPLMRPTVAGMDVRGGTTGTTVSSHNPMVTGATGMPFPFIGPNGAPTAFIPGQPMPAVSAGQHPGPGYHVSGPNGPQQQMFPPFIPYPYFLVPSQPFPPHMTHDQQRQHLLEMGMTPVQSDHLLSQPQQVFTERDGAPNRAGSNHSHSSGGGQRRRNRNQRKQSASTAESSPSTPPHHFIHTHPHHHPDHRQPVTPSHVLGAESRQTRSSSSSSSHVVHAASPPTSLSSCPCFSDEEIAAASVGITVNEQSEQQLEEQPEQQSDSAACPLVEQQQQLPAAAAIPVSSASPVPSVSEGKKLTSKKISPSVVKSVPQINGHSSPAVVAAAPSVSSKPPSGPKSWSSLFKSSLPAAPAAPSAGIHTQSSNSATPANNKQQMYDRVCLGGTFDSIHDGHKKLLNQSLAKCSEVITIGVTDEAMIRKKVLWEMIKPVTERIEDVRGYCESYLTGKGRSGLKLNIVPISDPFGPAITDVSLKAIVVSDETIAGAAKINEIRKSSGMPLLHVVTISLVHSDHKESSQEEDKVSSSTLRMRKLGTLLREPAVNNRLAKKPYLIGLTGGIASGKTSISNEFKKLGAGIIDCDKMAHLTYRPGSRVYDNIVREFGRDVVDMRTSEILRNKLGAKIFGNEAAKAKLESMVWPETSKLVFQEAERLRVQEKKEVVILEAAQIIEAKWTDRLHQVWVTMLPEDVAVKRVMERNSLSENEARQRVNSQMPNKERLSHANVVFSTLWDREFTRAQVQRAWNMLQKRFLRPV